MIIRNFFSFPHSSLRKHVLYKRNSGSTEFPRMKKDISFLLRPLISHSSRRLLIENLKIRTVALSLLNFRVNWDNHFFINTALQFRYCLPRVVALLLRPEVKTYQGSETFIPWGEAKGTESVNKTKASVVIFPSPVSLPPIFLSLFFLSDAPRVVQEMRPIRQAVIPNA